jgi:hypothetical protein
MPSGQREAAQRRTTRPVPGEREHHRQCADDQHHQRRARERHRHGGGRVVAGVAREAEHRDLDHRATIEDAHGAKAARREHRERGERIDREANDCEIEARIGRDRERTDEAQAPQRAGEQTCDNAGEHETTSPGA